MVAECRCKTTCAETGGDVGKATTPRPGAIHGTPRQKIVYARMTGSINAVSLIGVTITRYFPKTTEVHARDGAPGVDTAEIVLMLSRGDETMKMALRLVNKDGSVDVQTYSGPMPVVGSEFWFSGFILRPKMWRVTRVLQTAKEADVGDPAVTWVVSEIDVYLEPA